MSAANDDVLAMMDALLRKHHDAAVPPRVVPDLPTLTEVVSEEVNPIPVLLEEIPEAPKAATPPEPARPETPPRRETTAPTHAELDLKIQALLEQRLSAHFVASLDKALAVMLDQFSTHLEFVIREAVEHELRAQLNKILESGKSDPNRL